MKTTILIDFDILVYQIAFAMEIPIYVCKNAIFKTRGHAEVHSKKTGMEVFKRVNIGSEQELRKKLKQKMNSIFDALCSHDYKGFITSTKDEPNYRDKIATILPYKGNRAGKPKPQHYRRLRQILVDEWGAVEVHGQEADDQLAIEQMAAYEKTGDFTSTIIASIDKDLLSVPGQHYNMDNGKGAISVSFRDAFRNACRQLLCGDSTDNIPGLVRILKLAGREKEASSLAHHSYLKKFERDTVDYDAESCYNYVLGMYEGMGYGEKEVREIFNLVWLRRYPGQSGYQDLIQGKLFNENNN